MLTADPQSTLELGAVTFFNVGGLLSAWALFLYTVLPPQNHAGKPIVMRVGRVVSSKKTLCYRFVFRGVIFDGSTDSYWSFNIVSPESGLYGDVAGQTTR